MEVTSWDCEASFCCSRVPTELFTRPLEGITVWLPWCTTDSACGLTTLSMTASLSTIQQVTLGLS